METGSVTIYNNARLATRSPISPIMAIRPLSLGGSLTLNSTSLKVTPSLRGEKARGLVETALEKGQRRHHRCGARKIKLDTSKLTKDDYAKNLEKFLGALTEDEGEVHDLAHQD